MIKGFTHLVRSDVVDNPVSRTVGEDRDRMVTIPHVTDLNVGGSRVDGGDVPER